MTVQLTQNIRVAGTVLNAGTTQSLGADIERQLVTANQATYVGPVPGSSIDSAVPIANYTSANMPPSAAKLGQGLIVLDGQLTLSDGVTTADSPAGFSAVGSGKRFSGYRVVLIGDSLTQRNSSGAMWAVGQSAKSMVHSVDGAFTWLNALCGKPFRIVNNAGIAGQRTNEIAARYDADVTAYRPDVVALMAGINDLGFAGYSAAVTIANLQAMADKAIKSAFLLFFTLTPQNSLTNSTRIHRAIVNQWIADYCRAHQGQCLLVDSDALTVNNALNSGAWLAGYATDGTHPSAMLATYNQIKNNIAKIKELFSGIKLISDGSDTYDGSGSPAKTAYTEGQNLFTHAMSFMVGSGGTSSPGSGSITGTPPVGYILQNSGGTQAITVTTSARADNAGNNLSLAMTGLTSASVVELFWQPDPAVMFNAGKYYEFTCRITVVSGAPSSALGAVYAFVREVTTSFNYVRDCEPANTLSSAFPFADSFIIRTPRYLFSSGETIRAGIIITGVAAGSAQIYISEAAFRQYDDPSW